MTKAEKDKIYELRSKGYGYKKIANEMDISISTIVSFIKRNKKDDTAKEMEEVKEKMEIGFCLQCGKELTKTNSPRGKKFCNDECRMKYWKENRDKLKRKNPHLIECKHCKKKFTVYGKSNRKFCSIECSVKERFFNG